MIYPGSTERTAAPFAAGARERGPRGARCHATYPTRFRAQRRRWILAFTAPPRPPPGQAETSR